MKLIATEMLIVYELYYLFGVSWFDYLPFWSISGDEVGRNWSISGDEVARNSEEIVF